MMLNGIFQGQSRINACVEAGKSSSRQPSENLRKTRTIHHRIVLYQQDF
jgi:hypothetical protein